MPANHLQLNPMFNYTDGVVIVLIALALSLFHAVRDLLEIFDRGIFIDQKSVLMKKTCKQLRGMLKGHRRISHLKKQDLVEMVLCL